MNKIEILEGRLRSLEDSGSTTMLVHKETLKQLLAVVMAAQKQKKHASFDLIMALVALEVGE